MNWYAFPAQPKQSGAYIVAHRGTQKVIKFLANPEKPIRGGNTKYGWQEDPREFGATHWAPIAEVPPSDTPRQMLRVLPVGTKVKFTTPHMFQLQHSPKRKVKPAVWCWKKLKWYREPFVEYKKKPCLVSVGDTGVVIESSTGRNALEKVYKIRLDSEGIVGFLSHPGFVECNRFSGYPFTPVNAGLFTNDTDQGLDPFVRPSDLLLK